MIVDSSALICVLFNEPEAPDFLRAMERASVRRMGAPLYLESCIVAASRYGPLVLQDLAQMVRISDIDIVPFTEAAAHIASDSFMKYGKGRHRAALNFADCMSYALAKTEVMPLLFKGDDFRLTDVEPAI